MSKWIVYSKDGLTERCEVRKLEYSGSFLGDCSVTVSISSPTPIRFSIGDYIEYRNERFELNYDPSVIKQSSYDTYGEGFTYEDIKFNSLSDELTRCEFLDYVKFDNLMHYSSLPTFSFYADSVEKLAERIQVNLDRIYTGDNAWTITVDENFTSTANATISVSSINCWEALALVKEHFDANFVIRGRTVTIGTTGIAVDNLFGYGKGNGLISIERNAEQDQAIVTRLRAYGSTRNMPVSYYKNLGMKVFVTIGGYSVADGSVSFHLGTKYNSLGAFTSKWSEDIEGVSYTPYKVKVRLDEVSVNAMVALNSGDTGSYINVSSSYESDSNALAQFLSDFDSGNYTKLYVDSGVDKNAFPYDEREYMDNVPNNMAVQNLMLPSFPNETLDPYIDSENIGSLGIREGTVFFDGSGDLEEIYPSMEGMTAEDLIAAGVSTSASGALDEVYSAEQIADDGVFGENTDIPAFTITLKDIGFDINDYLSSQGAAISMKDGMCGGREFEIVECVKEGDYYILTCNRSEDSSLGLYFPYKDFQIQSGDKFVLLNIEMPDVYIKAASQRLLEAATEWLAKNDYVRYSYTPKVDNIWMQRQHDGAAANGEESIHDIIKEGDLLLFEDSDLGISGSIIIDQLTIKEHSDDSIIPEYEVTLRNDKVVGTIEKLQNQIDSVASGKGGGGSYSSSQIQSLIKAYGDKMYLRKDRDDRSEGKIEAKGFNTHGSIRSLLAGKGSIVEDGLVQTDRLEVRDSMTVMEIIFNRLSAMESNYAFSAAATIESVEEREDDEGNAYYRLTFRKRWDNDFHAFEMNDIIYGQANDLASGGRSYYTSWMRVLEYSDTTTNQVDVVLWADELVPGGVNYPPEVLMNVIQRGNTDDTERQSFWSLSALDEKCLIWLEGVDAPILREENYYMILGKLKDLSIFDNLPINYSHSYMYARGAIVQELFRVDFQGVVKKDEVNRGAWSVVIAESVSPYKATDTSYDVVYHRGCKWRCLLSGTLQEPSYAASDWLMLEGDPNYYLDFDSSMGWQFFRTQVNTEITAKVSYANEDITDILMSKTSTTVVWSRDSGDITDDNTWSPTLVDGQPHVIHLTVSDMGPNWGFTNRKVKFTCTVYIQDGDDTSTASNSITI